MRRFQVSGDENHLSLTMQPSFQQMLSGCMLLAFTFMCVTVLAVLSIVKGDVDHSSQAGLDALNFINPRGNHFGFLWATTTLLTAILTPVFALKVVLAPIIFRFDREKNLFTRCGKAIAPLSKVEAVHIRHADDPDNRSLHMLIVVHSDGFETPLDNWYDEEETNFVAGIIAEFCGVRVRGMREDHFEDGGMVPRSDGLGW